MSVYRYKAVPTSGAERNVQVGELTADSEPQVRAALRRLGLHTLQVRRLGSTSDGLKRWTEPIAVRTRRYLISRRANQRAELFDSMATMLDSGIPLLDAIHTVISSTGRHEKTLRVMLLQLREALRDGQSLSDAMTGHPSWFHPTEIAMVHASQRTGALSDTLRTLANRYERAGALEQKLIGALTYPAIVAVIGFAVAMFLSLKTLPDLTQILVTSDVEVPRLTSLVMGLGQWLVGSWIVILMVIAALVAAFLLVGSSLRRRGVRAPRWTQTLTPRVVRRVAVARVSMQLAQLIRSGVPFVESLQIIGPTCGSRQLRDSLETAASCVQRGDEIAEAMSDNMWFDAEFRRLLDVGQATGELDVLLERVAGRYERKANRLIDQLTSILEPAVLLLLAILVGTVVMAAVLPLVRLQEIL